MTTTPTLAELSEELDTATAVYRDAKTELIHAQKTATAATNRVNTAQRALDVKLSEMRKAAPQDTDWNRPQSFRVPGGLGT